MMRLRTLSSLLTLAAIGCSRPASAPAHGSPTFDEAPPKQRTSAPTDALSDVIQIGATHQHTCALSSDGQVYCWGMMEKIGRSYPRPRRVAGLAPARAIVIDDGHSFAVERTGEVMAWGGLTGPHYRHRLVETGRGRPHGADETEPPDMVEMPTESLDVALSAEAAAKAHPEEVWLDTSHTSFSHPPPQWRITARAVPTRLHTDGRIFVADGMLCTHGRDGGLSCVRPYFVDAFPSWHESQVRLEPDLIDMANSAMPEVCMLRRDGSVECVRFPAGEFETWGGKHFRIDRVPLPDQAVAIAADGCTAVLLRDGRVVTWCETNERGRLETKTNTNPHIDDAIAIEMERSLICVLRRSDAVTCWYEAHDSHFYMPTPRTITTLDHPTQIAVGDRHVCALLADGHVQCWGGNERGQLGNGTIDGNLGVDDFPPLLIPDTPPTFVVAPEDPPP